MYIYIYIPDNISDRLEKREQVSGLGGILHKLLLPGILHRLVSPIHLRQGRDSVPQGRDVENERTKVGPQTRSALRQSRY